MILNNRTADPEAHPHSLWLGRVKSFKKPRAIRTAEACARIGQFDHDCWLAIQFSDARLNPKSSLSVHDPGHGLKSIFYQVQKHLLQLNIVPADAGKSGGQLQ